MVYYWHQLQGSRSVGAASEQQHILNYLRETIGPLATGIREESPVNWKFVLQYNLIYPDTFGQKAHVNSRDPNN